jgi:hypothetical protein
LHLSLRRVCSSSIRIFSLNLTTWQFVPYNRM